MEAKAPLQQGVGGGMWALALGLVQAWGQCQPPPAGRQEEEYVRHIFESQSYSSAIEAFYGPSLPIVAR